MLAQRRAVHDPVLGKHGDDRTGRKDVAGDRIRIDPPQRPIIIAAEEGKRRRQCAGADAGDDVELRPVASLAPADQQPGAERAVIAAAGNHQKPQRPRRSARLDPPLLDILRDRVDARGIIHLEARIGNIEDAGFLRLRDRDRGQSGKAAAAAQHRCGADAKRATENSTRDELRADRINATKSASFDRRRSLQAAGPQHPAPD